MPSTSPPFSPSQYQSLTTLRQSRLLFFFFNDPATTEIYTLSLHDALPISQWLRAYGPVTLEFPRRFFGAAFPQVEEAFRDLAEDRKSTRLNSSHVSISYAVFCLKKKNPNLSST